jgi:hypothetical protein
MVANEYLQFYCLIGPEHLQCGSWNVLRTLMTTIFSSLKCFMRKISLILIRNKDVYWKLHAYLRRNRFTTKRARYSTRSLLWSCRNNVRFALIHSKRVLFCFLRAHAWIKQNLTMINKVFRIPKYDKRTTTILNFLCKSNSKYELDDRNSIPARGRFFSSQLYIDRLHSPLDILLSSYQRVLPTMVKRPDHETELTSI